MSLTTKVVPYTSFMTLIEKEVMPKAHDNVRNLVGVNNLLFTHWSPLNCKLQEIEIR